ncbi:hypothetical protein PSAC2689_40254 [Paraburkholderia sacchari]
MPNSRGCTGQWASTSAAARRPRSPCRSSPKSRRRRTASRCPPCSRSKARRPRASRLRVSGRAATSEQAQGLFTPITGLEQPERQRSRHRSRHEHHARGAAAVELGPQQHAGQRKQDQAARDGVHEQHPADAHAHAFVQIGERREDRALGAPHGDGAVAHPVLRGNALARPHQHELPGLGLHDAALAPRDRMRALAADLAGLAVELEFALEPARERLGRGGTLGGQRELHLCDLRRARRNVHRPDAMVEQKARHAEQQPQHGAPESHPAMHLAQPLDEVRAARALVPFSEIGGVEGLGGAVRGIDANASAGVGARGFDEGLVKTGVQDTTPDAARKCCVPVQ